MLPTPKMMKVGTLNTSPNNYYITKNKTQLLNRFHLNRSVWGLMGGRGATSKQCKVHQDGVTVV
jgi:hypothetical protein